MAEKKSVLTSTGAKKLRDELEMRKIQKRDEIKQKLKEARAQGDLSENAEYDAAKEEQGANEDRIVEIEKILQNAEIVDEVSDTTRVFIGSVVTVLDIDFDEEIEYAMVGANEVDSMDNKISQDSPLGSSLMGARVGDVVKYNAPGGEFSMKVLAIRKAEEE